MPSHDRYGSTALTVLFLEWYSDAGEIMDPNDKRTDGKNAYDIAVAEDYQECASKR